MTNGELRAQASARLWRDRWLGRLIGGGLLLGLCGSLMNALVSGLLYQMNVPDWMEYALAFLTNLADLTTPVPNLTREYIFQATTSTMLELFLGGIMAGIAFYGCAVILCRCLTNDEDGWLGAAFGGFRDPFGMLGLLLRQALVYLGWLFVAFALMSVVGRFLPTLANVALVLAVLSQPFYRYRYLWLVKADHPDWSAGDCLRSCRRLMKGKMLRSFGLDLSYWQPILAIVALLTVAEVTRLPFLRFAGSVAMIVASQFIRVSQGLFYRELSPTLR